MITFYTGTPGSGKSYHLAQRCFEILRYNKTNIIANFALNMDYVAYTWLGWLKHLITDKTHGKITFSKYNKRALKGHFEYWSNPEITPENLLKFANEHHKKQKEGQTLVIIDEAGIVYNCRQFGSKDRQDWTDFFAKHRHYGFDFILATQFDRQVDKQIRMCVEYEMVHRKLRNYQFLGLLLSLLAGGNIFIAKQYWYASRDKLVIKTRAMRYRSRIGSLYDTYAEFSRDGSDAAAGGELGGPARDAPEPIAEPTPDCVAQDAVAASALSRLRSSIYDFFHSAIPQMVDHVELSDLFGGNVDVTKPLSDREAHTVPVAGVCDDDLNCCDADHDTSGGSSSG
ncbi:zonular occludens toxin domain-containing protein [Butyricicoccus faecihominis]|uniref:zonular occludens toxin domain-containing protein n=1 Tax=Butyricicoccus faecihominis TaxID=1712515 RepID=UPI002478F935|nr:zonular occludens toxin domain-containing protein [Butyricicoccus faecihominis]MCQ5129827.1 zonular occludens toxin domain-containing protein [Butyricicoccus faecihominis]